MKVTFLLKKDGAFARMSLISQCQGNKASIKPTRPLIPTIPDDPSIPSVPSLPSLDSHDGEQSVEQRAPRESPRPGIPPETGMPQEAPGEDIVHPIQPHIPQLDPPLIGDRERFRELQEQFQLYYLGRNGITDLAKFAGRLERCVPIERDIEAALVLDGYDPDRIRGRISEIRGRLFTHPNKALLLSERTLDEYLTEIRTNGTRGSRPYMRLVQAIRNSDILL